jgi:hypothetical protein
MRRNAQLIRVEEKDYALKYDYEDPFVVENLLVAYSDELAVDFMPVIYDPRGYGSTPHPPESVAYRLVIDPERQRLCVIYEVYWKRQECTWKQLNKSHDHDYEQIQIHFNLKTGLKEKVVVSSSGPIEHGGHGVEVYSNTTITSVKTVIYTTSPKEFFPWGGKNGQNKATQLREIPIKHLFLENGKPAVVVLNCYHAFAGLKRRLLPEEKNLLTPKLERLNRELLEKWCYLHFKNRFGRDLSNPFNEPYLMYYPPPEHLISRVTYTILWIIARAKRLIGL